MSTTSPAQDWQTSVMRATNSLAASYGAPDDVGRILAYLSEVFPNRPEIVAAQVRVLLMQKNYSDARAMLSKSEEANPRSPVIKAMTAICLYIQGDPLWEAYVQETLALPPNAVSTAVVASLMKASGKAFNAPAAGAAAEQPAHDYSFVGLAC